MLLPQPNTNASTWTMVSYGMRALALPFPKPSDSTSYMRTTIPQYPAIRVGLLLTTSWHDPTFGHTCPEMCANTSNRVKSAKGTRTLIIAPLDSCNLFLSLSDLGLLYRWTLLPTYQRPP